MDSGVTADFIFGTLGTDALRLQHEQSRLHGVWHGARFEPRDPRPGDVVEFTVTAGIDVSIDHMELLLTRDGAVPGNESESIAMTLGSTEWSTIGWGYVQSWTCRIEAEHDELLRYVVRAATPNGEVIYADEDPITGAAGLFAISIDTDPEPDWLRDAVVYQVFVDRFARTGGEPFLSHTSLMEIWGGTLRGLNERLGHIRQVGANAIWLTPIFPSPTHHGYDVTDYTSIEPRLGTLADFDDLVSNAHAQGLRVILDFVASHCSNHHPVFQRALADTGSPERQLFTIHADGSYESFFGVKEMPRINGDNDEALAWMIDSATFWLGRGVDGFRLDYSIGQSLQFWTRFSRALRRVRSDVALIAEAVDSAETLRAYRGSINGVLDFLFLEHVRSFLGFGKESASAFWRFYERHSAFFEQSPTRLTFLDNHDMNRFLWVVEGDTRRLKIAALLQMSLPDPTVVYYGSEVGLNQWHDLEFPDGSRRMEESRTPMLWGADQDADLLGVYRSLVFWRKQFAIARQSPDLVHAGDDGTLIYRIGPWLVVINSNTDDLAIDVGSGGAMWLSLATDRDVHLHGSVLHLPAWSGAILANERAR